jgi:protein phosphatase
MILRICAESDTGNFRKNNEDMVLVGSVMFRDLKYNTTVDLCERNTFFIAIADGMGGHNAGDYASERTIREIAGRVSSLSSDLTPEQLGRLFESWVKEIDSGLKREGALKPEYQGMGTTLVGLLYYNGEFYSVNAGDSRLYRYSDGELSRLTRDHSLREMTGNMSYPSNILANAIGGGSDVFIDFKRIGSDVKNGELFMLSSDGLHDAVNDQRIRLLIEKNLVESAPELVKSAKDSGGRDNISVVVIEIGEVS